MSHEEIPERPTLGEASGGYKRKDMEQSEENPRKKSKNELTVRTKLGSVGVRKIIQKRGRTQKKK